MSMAEISLPNNWRPRPYQLNLWKYLEGGGTRAVEVAHRRWGKDDVALHWTASAAFQRIGNYWHMLPEYNQARKAVWEAVNPNTGKRRIDEAFPMEICERRRDDTMFIRFKNGSTWQLVGSDNYNSLVGSPPIGLVFSEYSIANPSAWAYLMPILEENGGWAVFIYTSRGKNHGYDLLQLAKKEPGWFGEISTPDITAVFKSDQLERIQRQLKAQFGEDLGEAMYQQEYWCSFTAAIPGSFFGALMEKAENEGRICELPYKPGLPVWTAWDLGVSDDTSIAFAQRDAGWTNVIDHYATNGQDGAHYVKLLKSKPYIYAGHFMPHDADRVDGWVNATNRLDSLRTLGLTNLHVVDRTLEIEGINAVRLLLPSTRFDAEKCKGLIESLRNHRREYDEEKRAFKPTSIHDWTAHDAAAMRYLAQGLTPEAAIPPDIPRYSKKRWRHSQTTTESGWAA